MITQHFKITAKPMNIHKNRTRNILNKNKNAKSKGQRPKAKVTSHNACRYGCPFFLSPSNDDAMLENPNPTPLSTRLRIIMGWFCGSAPTKRKINLARFPS